MRTSQAAAVTFSATAAAFLRPAALSQRSGPLAKFQEIGQGPYLSHATAAAYSQRRTVAWARRKRRDDELQRFDLDELRVEKRFGPVDEIDPDLYRPSKMEYYVPPPPDREIWDMPDTRYIAIGLDKDGDEVFEKDRLPNCYLHLAWARRSYLDKSSPVAVWWDYALVRPDLQGNRGNIFGMNATSASQIKAFIESDPYQKLGLYKSLEGYRWRPVNELSLMYAGHLQWLVVGIDKKNGLEIRKRTREAHLAYLRATERVCIAGPLFSLKDEEGTPVGSLIIFNAEDDAEARAFLKEDPYTLAGLFRHTYVTQLCELDVSGQHQDRQWQREQTDGRPYYDPVEDLMYQWGLKVDVNAEEAAGR